MKLIIDTERMTLTQETEGGARTVPLYSREAFELVSEQWLKVGWNEKYGYTFSWLGRPIIQLPEDILRIQEVIYRAKPDVVVETGVAHGGSLILYATLFKAMGRGRVVGVDIEIRPHNREAIEAHELASYITLVEGSSTDPKVVKDVSDRVRPGERVMVILDSDHSKKHVLAELEAYHPLVSVDSYLVATDGIMKQLADVPRGKPEWVRDNPFDAAAEFASKHPEFALEQPAWPFNESGLGKSVTHWPGAWLRRVR